MITGPVTDTVSRSSEQPTATVVGAALGDPRQPSTTSSRRSMSGSGSVRRNARLRREYLYRKSLEATERLVYDRKKQLKEAIAGASSWFPPAACRRLLTTCRPPAPPWRSQRSCSSARGAHRERRPRAKAGILCMLQLSRVYPLARARVSSHLRSVAVNRSDRQDLVL